jgi:hypothetical protein
LRNKVFVQLWKKACVAGGFEEQAERLVVQALREGWDEAKSMRADAKEISKKIQTVILGKYVYNEPPSQKADDDAKELLEKMAADECRNRIIEQCTPPLYRPPYYRLHDLGKRTYLCISRGCPDNRRLEQLTANLWEAHSLHIRKTGMKAFQQGSQESESESTDSESNWELVKPIQNFVPMHLPIENSSNPNLGINTHYD